MSDTHAETVAFVRDTMLPEREPPASTTGAVGWMRQNLFSGVLNSALTVLSLLFVLYVLATVLPWIMSPTWNAASLTECRALLLEIGREGHFSGACWGVIRDRWVQLFFGFYPADLYWRPILAFLLLAVALAPVLFSDKVPAKLLWFTAVYPLIFPWLLWGGAVWVPLLVLLGLVLAFAIYKLVESRTSSLMAIIVATIFVAAWFVWGLAAVSGATNTAVGTARIDSRLVQLNSDIEALSADSTRLDAEIKETQASINEALKVGDDALASGEGAYAALIDKVKPERVTLANLRTEKNVVDTQLSDMETLKRRILDMPALEEKLPALRDAAAQARAALPDTVSHIHTENGLKAFKVRIVAEDLDIPAGDVDALEEALKLESDAKSTQSTIDMTYADVARIGLRPVQSRDFGGMMLSLTIGVVAIAISLPLGILLALGRQSDLPLLKSLCVGFIEFIRGVPLITLLFVASTLLNIFLPPGTSFDIILRVIIMATLFASAYMAEVIRGGLAALPTGQYEGADSLGLNYWQAQRLIIMPQALKISIPGIVSTFIGLFKDTTLVSIIGLLDPLGLSTAIRADSAWNGIVWEIYGFIALMFFIFCFSMSRYSMYLERKLHTGR